MSDAPKTVIVDFNGNGTASVISDVPVILGTAEYTLTASVSARLKAADEALQWYAAQVAGCRKHGRDGDIARAKLDRDGGYMARQALAGPNAGGDKKPTEGLMI